MFSFLLAFLGGVLLPVQAGVNSTLKSHLGHPFWASLVSFLVGTTALILLVTGLRLPIPQMGGAPLWTLSGGLFGVVYVTLAVVLTPRIGSANFIGLAIAGQLIASLLLDHFGWLGVPQHSLNGSRVLGALLLMGGVWLLSQK